jgi:two-component system chemotaxis family response regulator WspR
VGDRRRILVVDDEMENCALLARLFHARYDVLQAVDGEQALATALRERPHVVITDQRMPGLSGVELLARLRDELPHAIRVLVSGYAEFESLVDAVNAAGVHHFVEKPFHATNLRRLIDTLVDKAALEAERVDLLAKVQASEARLQKLVEERTRELELANQKLEASNKALKKLVVRDGLTGVHNHRYLQEYLQIEVARSSRYKREFGLLFIDIDDFKRINDEHGHKAGDEVLVRVAEQLQAANRKMRESDFAARYGGEEFVVILPETDVKGAQIKAERIRAAVAQLAFDGVGRVTVSIGVAAYPLHGADPKALLEAADKALYRAKRAGKNQVALVG